MMGVPGLWNILGELAERRDINDLSGKRVAVDLSGWVVQATSCKGLNVAKNPHVRNLFFRVSRLLRSGVHPIFVMEGEMPMLKKAVLNKRNYFRGGNTDRSRHDQVLKECQILLNTLGVPCIKSSGEAEAYCAFLCSKKLVDGVITEDNDALLYGADPVYREFTIDRTDPHVNMYSLKSRKNRLNLDQPKLIVSALLLGSDYVKGVPGIGKEAVLKLFSELQGCDILQRFKDWKTKDTSELFPGYDANPKKQTHCTRCAHTGSCIQHKKRGCEMCNSKITCYLQDPKNPCSCDWHKYNDIRLRRKTEFKIYKSVKEKMPDFPNLEVIDEYINYIDEIPNEDAMEWKCPNLKEFQDKAFRFLGWTFSYSHKKFLPIMTSWQQNQLNRSLHVNTSCFLYKPVKIVKQRIVSGEDCLEVEWTLIGSEDQLPDLDETTLTTVENENTFKNSYPEIAEAFYHSLQKVKREPKLKPKTKFSKAKKDNKLLTDFYSASTNESKESPENHVSECIASGKRILSEDSNEIEPHIKKQCLSI